MNGYKNIDENPTKNGSYLVKFYTRFRPEYDCTELAWRKFIDGEWINPIYNYKGDGYELIGWYENQNNQ